jgi:hypothetical protein
VIYLALGRREQGKTTLAYYIVSRLSRRLVFDPRGMIRTDRSDVFTSGGRLFREGMDAFHNHELTEVVMTPGNDVATNFAVFCREAANYVRKNPDSHIGILIDEIRFVDLKNEDLDWILRCAPVDHVHIVFTGHRPKDVPTDIRAIADRWLLFSFTLPRDVEIIEDQTSPAVAREVQRLQSRQFVTWDDRTARATYHRDPAVWFVQTKTKQPASIDTIDTLPAGDEVKQVPIDRGNLFS